MASAGFWCSPGPAPTWRAARQQAKLSPPAAGVQTSRIRVPVNLSGLNPSARDFWPSTEKKRTLLDRARKHWKLSSLNELIEFANSNPAPNFTTFAPFVVAAAEQGDSVAQQVLARAGQDLAYLAGLVIGRIRKLESESSGAFTPPPVAVAGSILGKVAPVRAALTESLRSIYPEIEILDAPADPVRGALWRARKGA